MTVAEAERATKASEAKSRAVVLEMIGDIPDAEMKPPDNVVFVAKLNPLTQDADLDIIFGRFGDIFRGVRFFVEIILEVLGVHFGRFLRGKYKGCGRRKGERIRPR